MTDAPGDLPPLRIHLSPPDVGATERSLLLDAFDSNWIAPLGPHVDGFEQEFVAWLAAAGDGGGPWHGVALSSGTAGLHLALLDAGVGPSDEVVTATFTFAATANAITYVGATPVFIDADPTTWQMDPALLEQLVDQRLAAGRPVPAAVVTVDLYGLVPDHAAIRAVCQRHGMVLVEDAAEALGTVVGTESGARAAGTLGDVGVFSFNGNKVITTSGGGMLVTRDADQAEHFRFLATQARDPAPHYQHSTVGYNYRLSNLLAAVGRGQLAGLDDKVARRQSIQSRYRERLSDLPGVTLLTAGDDVDWNSWLTCLQVDAGQLGVDREALRLALRRAGIEARPVWKPMHLQPLYADHEVVDHGVATALFRDGLCLPTGSSLSDAEVDEVAGIIIATAAG